MIDYKKRLSEVYVILNHLSISDYRKIPKDIIDAIKENKDDSYVWEYDESKPLKKQNVSRDTIAILSFLNKEYLLNNRQKNYVESLHKINQEKFEAKKRELYNPDDLFKNKGY